MAAERIIRDKAFAKRLSDSVENNPKAQSGHGRQKWLREQLAERFNAQVSAESVRKWFAGENRPRPEVTRLIAQLLDVDYAWLSLGVTPEASEPEKRKRKVNTTGAINYLAGLIQLNGGSIAYPEKKADAEYTPDLFAIVGGAHYTVEVKYAKCDDDAFTITVPPKYEDLVVISVVETKNPMAFDLVRIPSDIITKSAEPRGGFLALAITRRNGIYRVDGVPLPVIRSLDDFVDQPVRTRPVRKA